MTAPDRLTDWRVPFAWALAVLLGLAVTVGCCGLVAFVVERGFGS